MTSFITTKKRTHYCGELRPSHAGYDVIIMGWVHKRRDLGQLIFIDLRDREGLVQIVFDPDTAPSIHDAARKLRGEYVIAVQGTVKRRPDNMINSALPTGEIEIEVKDLEILNLSEIPPFVVDDDTDVGENTVLTYRYLDLRRPRTQHNIFLRSEVAAAVRSFFHDNGFIEVETPLLTKSTPEGARDYLVPSRISKGMFYALPQSPQLFKQMLMIAGFDRYYQIVKCFRDEDLRADRQPEFTQIDVEMSFVDENDIVHSMEQLMAHIFDTCLGVTLTTPFPRLSYEEAISSYGKDNPDTRFGMVLHDISDIARSSQFSLFSDAEKAGHIVKAIAVENGISLSRKDLDGLTDIVKPYGARGIIWARVKEDGWTSSVAKHLTTDEMTCISERTCAGIGDILLIVVDTPKIVNEALGTLRVHLAKKLDLIPADAYAFTWVTEFPMFEFDEGDDRYYATHHPFTSPHADDLHLLEKDPSRVRARAYDLVLNGFEIGGGSIRIHSSDLQARVFKVLNLSDVEAHKKFGFFLKALQYGTPPHGGIAFGFDRIIMLMAGTDSIRHVIAFPKTQKATCLLTEAPSPVGEEQLAELSLKAT